MDIITALRAGEGICCLVGAGGKKTTMYALANRLDRAVVTATVRIPPFDAHVAAVEVTQDPAAAIGAATQWPLGVVPARDGPDRYRGYDPSTVDELVDAPCDAILVKADGARMRRFKAPGSKEPRLPRASATVIPVVSAHVVGEPLDDRLVHRVGRVAAIAGISPGERITASSVARVIASDRGGRKDVPPGASVVPLVNMVDDAGLREVGVEIARAIHRHTDVSHVVLAAMRQPDPLVAVI